MAVSGHRFNWAHTVLAVGATVLIGAATPLGQARAEPSADSSSPAVDSTPPQTGVRTAESAREVVEHFHAALLNAMRDAKTLGYAGRYKLLDRVIRASFNLQAMSQIVSGSFWNELDATQKAKLVDHFSRMTIATYAARFDGYDGEKFETVAEEPAPRDGKLVKTRLVRVGEEPVNFNYMLREYDGDWRIVDIYLAGTFSEMATKRSEYTSVLKNQGFDTLIARLDTHIADFAAGKK